MHDKLSNKNKNVKKKKSQKNPVAFCLLMHAKETTMAKNIQKQTHQTMAERNVYTSAIAIHTEMCMKQETSDKNKHEICTYNEFFADRNWHGWVAFGDTVEREEEKEKQEKGDSMWFDEDDGGYGVASHTQDVREGN